MPTASARLIQHQAKFIKQLLGGDKNFARLLETYLQVAASTSGISQKDVASTLGWSAAEAKSILSDNSIFDFNEDGLVRLAPLGMAILGGCFGIPWAAIPNGLFTADEESQWDELFLELDKFKSGVKGLTVGQLLWKYFLLNIKSETSSLSSSEQLLDLAIQKVVGKQYLSEKTYVRNLVATESALNKYRAVANIAYSIRIDIGPNLFRFYDEGDDRTVAAAKAANEAFDMALQASPHALAVFLSLGEKPWGLSALAKSLDCTDGAIEAAIVSLGSNVTGAAKKYSLSSTGEVLFMKHFLHRSDFSAVATTFMASSIEQRTWYRAEQVLLNAEVGPKGERLKDIAPRIRSHADNPYLDDGVTLIDDLLSSLGLSSIWNAQNTSAIKDVRVLLSKIPALKEFRTGITYAKKYKL